MRKKFNKLVSAGLIAVLVLGGFFAEYAHRHTLPSTDTFVTAAGEKHHGATSSNLAADKCVLCHVAQQAINTQPSFSLTSLDLQQGLANFYVVVPFSQEINFSFQLRAPPSFLS
jgi:hypothetical protein